MTYYRKTYSSVNLAFLSLTFLLATPTAFGQVSPMEIKSPKLKTVEDKYLPQLESLHKAISTASFPFPFLLTRYVTSDPDRPGFDSRGLEFVNFQGQIVMKTSGIYRAAYDAGRFTQNERAVRTFREVIVPVLRLIVQEFPSDIDCDAIGFEISYHARAPAKSFEYEGKEILVVVLSRADAFGLPNQTDDQGRQAILNRSSIYVNGKDFGLSLAGPKPLDLEALDRSAPDASQGSAQRAGSGSARPPASNPLPSEANLQPSTRMEAGGRASSGATTAPPSAAPPTVAPSILPVDPKPAPTSADAERLQNQFQSQLDALSKEGAAKFHLADSAPPSFSIYHDKLILQLTLRNPQTFEKSSSSIYKRAAQSFDLFLAPELKALMPKIPGEADFDALDFSILNRLGIDRKSSEAIEFICPLKSVRLFVGDEITGQDLINQSVVLVNGVRIALNLQLVE
ncbi:MAG TPA: hypothetical protein VEF54_00200 [archaeon]|nr:hypothetical protein [archaeon]